MKKYYPMLLQPDLVAATIRDRKTETRRIVGKNLKIINENPDDWGFETIRTKRRLWDSTKEENPNPISTSFVFSNHHQEELEVKFPYGKEGDGIYVRETWQHTSCIGEDPGKFVYKADDNFYDEVANWKWKPSIHMPKAASRLILLNTDVNIERLHEITEEGAKAEGFSSISDFKQKWDEINAKRNPKYAWDANPWVIVQSYQVESIIFKNHHD